MTPKGALLNTFWLIGKLYFYLSCFLSPVTLVCVWKHYTHHPAPSTGNFLHFFFQFDFTIRISQLLHCWAPDSQIFFTQLTVIDHTEMMSLNYLIFLQSFDFIFYLNCFYLSLTIDKFVVYIHYIYCCTIYLSLSTRSFVLWLTYLDIVCVKGLIRSGREVSDLDLLLSCSASVWLYSNLWSNLWRERERGPNILLYFNF